MLTPEFQTSDSADTADTASGIVPKNHDTNLGEMVIFMSPKKGHLWDMDLDGPASPPENVHGFFLISSPISGIPSFAGEIPVFQRR